MCVKNLSTTIPECVCRCLSDHKNKEETLELEAKPLQRACSDVGAMTEKWTEKLKVKLGRHSFTAQKHQGAPADEENRAIDGSYTLYVQKSIPRESTAVPVGHCPRCCCRRFNEAQAKRQTTSWKTGAVKWTRTLMCAEGMSTAAKTTNSSTVPGSFWIPPFHRSFHWNYNDSREKMLRNVFDTKH